MEENEGRAKLAEAYWKGAACKPNCGKCFWCVTAKGEGVTIPLLAIPKPNDPGESVPDSNKYYI